MADIKQWKQSEVSQKVGATPIETREYRDEYLTAGEHWKKEGTSIMWSDHAMWMFKKHIANPAPVSTEIEVHVIGRANNPRFIYGSLNGFRIAIECHPKMAMQLQGKTVKVSLREENGETYYTYKP